MRTRLISVAMVCVGMLMAAPAQAGLMGGVFGGYNINLDQDLENVENISAGGLAFGGKVGFKLPAVTVGIMAGYLPILSYDVEATTIIGTVATEASSYSIPVLAFGQVDAGGMFFSGGVGVHNISSMTKTTIAGDTTETSDSETRTGFMLGAGYSVPTPAMSLETGVAYHMIMQGEEDGSEAVNMIMFSVGVNFGM